ncbi:hypothetical protein [Paraburkholderia acidisoli]|uniref:Lipoprotein n=1 Tax=Paraburkholderia acidisoli TaxID=2571748 RepID=A0A7Z2JIT0_9BURK|nr:hypothetical protein [Paraburkholderia acidisoli]QGZ65483.1 hypothetical protein FAZ98_27415 [Paraburkholderia acidisoli]
MSQRRTASRPFACVLISLLLASTSLLQGCATTAQNIALGLGIGTVGTVSALGCLLTCQLNDPRW